MSLLISSERINSDEPRVNFNELLEFLWLKKLTLVVIYLFTLVSSILVAFSLEDVYRSNILLAPADEDSGQGVAAQFGGLANLAGINLGEMGESKTNLAIEILKSKAFIQSFIKQNDLLVPIMAAKGWDRQSNQLIIDNELYDENTKEWVRKVDSPLLSRPSLQEAYFEFIDRLFIDRDRETGFVTVSIEFFSPYIAKDWLDHIILSLNNAVKMRDIVEAKKSISYLENQLEATALSEMKMVFFRLIEEQTKTIMFANVRDEYAFKTLDPAFVPEKKYAPKRLLIILVITLLGVVFATATYSFYYVAMLYSDESKLKGFK